MSTNVFLGVCLQPNKYQRIKLDNISLENKVEILREEVAKKINVQKQSIELFYCGVILEDDSSLSSCGVKSGATINVLEKKETLPPTPIKPLTGSDLNQLVVAFRTFTLSPGYRTSLQRLARPEILKNIIAATPGLAEDPVAIAIIRDPELIVQMSEIDVVRSMAELHPALIEAAHHIAAHVHEEAANVSQTQASTSSGYSYSLEALSDDEEMESPAEPSAAPLSRNSSYSAITATQLAAAIANATNTSFGLSSSPAENPASASSPVITSEMFNSAMQQAFATSQSSNSSNVTTPNRNVPEPYETMTSRLQPQLQQMNEMGLTNEAVNIRALQASSGDVQAAIELVLSGAFD